jgi:hypothetical protein
LIWQSLLLALKCTKDYLIKHLNITVNLECSRVLTLETSQVN